MQCEVEVWTARPDRLGAAACGELEGLLDAEERVRASRLRIEADRHAFIAAHAVRRLALGMLLETDPQDLRFVTGPHGQPQLQGMEGGAPYFSLTRSRGLVALAISARGRVGIDAEAVRPGPDESLLAPFMAQLPAGQPLDFHVQWTALEAFWKARGLGLSTEHPRIGLRPVEGDELFEVVYGETRQTAGFCVVRLPAPDGHVLSLACESPGPVRLVALDGLALAPGTDAFRTLARCREPLGDIAAAPGLVDTSPL